MILAPLYHSVGCGRYANSVPTFIKHFDWISRFYRSVFPGEPVGLFEEAVCLTFDDGYYDFYHFLFPLLKQFKLKALLSVPVQFIQPSTELPASTRLQVPYEKRMTENFFRSHVPFCTWQELREMVQSGYVQIASHSYSHQNLTDCKIDLALEIEESKKQLESILRCSIDTFVYPFGKMNRSIHTHVESHYLFIMRIGSAMNFSWKSKSGVFYRIPSDGVVKPHQLFTLSRKLLYTCSYGLNILRNK